MASISACGSDEVTSTSADVPGDIASPAGDVAATDTEYVDTAGSDVSST
jgi:hypothetical protein